jgi:hypothetical protein
MALSLEFALLLSCQIALMIRSVWLLSRRAAPRVSGSPALPKLSPGVTPAEEASVGEVRRTTHLHERLARAELAPVTGAKVSRLAKDLSETGIDIADAVAAALQKIIRPGEMTAEQVQRVASTAKNLVLEGLKLSDALSVALHERLPRNSWHLPAALRDRLLPPSLTGQNVVKFARELNALGTRMDDAIVLGLLKFSAPNSISPAVAAQIVSDAQRLFSGGVPPAEAFNVALRKMAFKAINADREQSVVVGAIAA